MAALRSIALVLSGLAVLTVGAIVMAPEPAAAVEGKYGCFKVTKVSALNIRRRAYSKSSVVGVARRGQKLGKWRRFCAIRGFWCPVKTSSGVRGWSDKRFLQRVSC